MAANVFDFPPPKPLFDAQLASDQRVQVEDGLKILLRRPGDPIVFRRGRTLYLPFADGMGVFRAKKADIQQFIMSHFEMVDVSVATNRNPNPIPKYRSIHTSVVAWLEHRCPEFVPEVERVVHMPVFVELFDDEVDEPGREYEPATRRLHLITTPGYDARAKIIYAPSQAFAAIDFSKNQFPSARAAYEYLRYELLADCLVGPKNDPRLTAANEASLLAALVTPAIKEIVGLAPGMLFWAESMSAGKTLFAGVLESIYSGRHSNPLSWASNEQEREWGIASRLEHEPPVVVIDNVKTTIRSGLLDMILTSEYVQLRAVGESAKVYRNRTMWIISANNPELDRDAILRFLPVQFRQHSSHDTGQYTHPHLFDYIIENRHRILGAIYQIIRAGDAWADPSELQHEQPPTWGKFPRWTDRIWRICKAVGINGFLDQKATDIAEPLDDVQVSQLLATMYRLHPSNWTVEDVGELVSTIRLVDPEAFNHVPFMVKARIEARIVMVFDAHAFGQWVRSEGLMHHDGLKIEKYRAGGKSLYKVSPV